MIRAATEEDCLNLTALSLQVWLNTYALDGIRTEYSEFALSTFTEQKFRELLISPSHHLLIYTDGDFIRGYILINLDSHFESKETSHKELGYEIEKLYVQDNFQGKGIGKEFLLEVGNLFGNRYWLYTWEENASIAFYHHLGFKDIGEFNFELKSGLIKNRVLAFS